MKIELFCKYLGPDEHDSSRVLEAGFWVDKLEAAKTENRETTSMNTQTVMNLDYKSVESALVEWFSRRLGTDALLEGPAVIVSYPTELDLANLAKYIAGEGRL